MTATDRKITAFREVCIKLASQRSQMETKTDEHVRQIVNANTTNNREFSTKTVYMVRT